MATSCVNFIEGARMKNVGGGRFLPRQTGNMKAGRNRFLQLTSFLTETCQGLGNGLLT